MLLCRARTSQLIEEDLELIAQSEIKFVREVESALFINKVLFRSDRNNPYQTYDKLNFRMKMNFVKKERVTACDNAENCSYVNNECTYVVTENCQEVAYDNLLKGQKQATSCILNNDATYDFYILESDESRTVLASKDFLNLRDDRSIIDLKRDCFKKLFQSQLILYENQVAVLTSNSCGTYVSSNQRVKVISCESNKLKVLPIEEANLITDFILLHPTKVDEKIPEKYLAQRFKRKNIYISQCQYPIMSTISSTSGRVMGITLPSVCFDNSRGVNFGEGYVALSRCPDSSSFCMVHKPKNLEEANEFDFRCDPIALKLHNYLENEINRNKSILVSGQFFFDESNTIRKKYTDEEIETLKRFDKNSAKKKNVFSGF